MWGGRSKAALDRRRWEASAGSGPWSLIGLCLLWQELDEMKRSGSRCLQDIEVDDTNVLLWKGLLVPVSMGGGLNKGRIALGGLG